MNLTLIQKIAITMAVLGVLSTSGVQLTDILGSGIAKSVVSVSGLINSVLAAIVAVISGQSAIIKQVAAMPGVEKVSVNADAGTSLAQAATDPTLKNVGATTPEVRQSLLAKAGS